MKWACFVLAVASSLAPSPSEAQTANDEEALRRLPAAFCAAWARHDGQELARIMAPDVEFVTVGATWLHGRADFEKYHSRLLSGRFKESTITQLKTSVRTLGRNLAVVHWSWSIAGDRNPDGSLRSARFGLMTMVAGRREGGWQVLLAQNTNSAAVRPPESEGITLPISVPPSN